MNVSICGHGSTRFDGPLSATASFVASKPDTMWLSLSNSLPDTFRHPAKAVFWADPGGVDSSKADTWADP